LIESESVNVNTMARMNAGASCSVVSIWKLKCKHAPEERIFSVVNHDKTFEKFESMYVCEGNMLEISLATKESGPWTCLDDNFLDLYKAEMCVIFKTFPDTRYIKLKCVEPEPLDDTIQDAGTETTLPTRNAFDIMMAQGNLNKKSLPVKKTSR